MDINIILIPILAFIILIAAFAKGTTLYKLFYIYSALLIFVMAANKNILLSFLLAGSIIPFIKIPSARLKKVKKEKFNLGKISSYIAFLPLLGLAMLSYQMEVKEVRQGSSIIMNVGEIILVIMTLVLILPKSRRKG